MSAAYVRQAIGPEDLTTMPFSKWKGMKIEDVDTGMLRWWLGMMDSDGLRPEYREAVLAVLATRPAGHRGNRPTTSGATSESSRPDPKTTGVASSRLILAAEFRCMIKAWFGQLSKRYHPDRGGSNEQQMVVNDAYKTIMSELDRWEKGA